jgi:hypothetical protein
LGVISCSGSGKFSLIEKKCGTCHSASIVYREKRSNKEWDRIIYAMKQRGLTLSDTEEKEIKEYLFENMQK